MKILDKRQIKQKVVRLAYQIIEQNTGASQVWLAGINNNGYAFAQILLEQLNSIKGHQLSFGITRLRLNPADPMANEISLETDMTELAGKTVIIVDDVANTGRTLFYSFKPFMTNLVSKLQVAVLIDRKHKSFPVKVDYVGLSLATTIHDNILVNLSNEKNWHVEIA